MSGHSKWSTIKRAKEKTDAQRSKIFTKIGRELAVVVKQGGSDISANPRLKDLIQKAKQNNMPLDSIERTIKKAAGELGGVNYESISYEGYGIGGSAVIVECLTDNKNRTAGDIRHAFDKFGGALGQNGCVSYLFKTKSVIIIEKCENIDEDEVMMLGLENGADDVVFEDDVVIFYSTKENHSSVESCLKDYNVLSSEISLVPDNYVELDEHKSATFAKMLDRLDDLDDVQNVYHNVK